MSQLLVSRAGKQISCICQRRLLTGISKVDTLLCNITHKASAGDRSAVEAEFKKNKALGESIGCWRGGVLVEDDAGSVRRALAAQEEQL